MVCDERLQQKRQSEQSLKTGQQHTSHTV
jgi:hypothetical protein